MLRADTARSWGLSAPLGAAGFHRVGRHVAAHQPELLQAPQAFGAQGLGAAVVAAAVAGDVLGRACSGQWGAEKAR
jgi:hypothetical protein